MLRFHLQDVMLGILFVGVFMASVGFAWNEGGMFLIHTIVSAVLILPPVYLVLLLMVRQRREQRHQ